MLRRLLRRPRPNLPGNSETETMPCPRIWRDASTASAVGQVQSKVNESCHMRVKSPFFTGPLRSPLRLQNTFAHECFMDEICSYTKPDPVAYRLQHLRETRIIDVVKAAAKTAHWDARPSPKLAPRAPAPSAGAVSLVLRTRATTDTRRLSPKWKWIRPAGQCSPGGLSSPTIVDRSPTPRACATRSKAAYCKE